MANLTKGVVLGTLGAALAGAAYALTLAGTLTIDGNSVPADIRTINGSAYVRLSDVGKALGMTVVSKGGGSYALTKAGGANAVGGRSGKIGDTLFDGKWRFTLLSVDRPEQYEMKTDAELYNEGDRARMARSPRVVTPGRGYGLVVLKVKISNGMKQGKTLWTAFTDPRVHTAIADMDGSSHRPVGYDFTGGPNQTEPMLPGAGMTFNVVFALPTEARAKDLVFTLLTNNGEDKGSDVRVSLAGS